MREVQLDSTPNQVTTAYFGGEGFTLAFRTFRGLTYATIRLETGEVIAGAVRCANRQWLIPWRRTGNGVGNFRFEDVNEQYPDYRNFGGACRLVFYSADEILGGEV